MAIANENYDVGGTGGAIFASNAAAAQPRRPPQQVSGGGVGDDYRPPPGLPDWKQPSLEDDDDRIPPEAPAPGPFANVLGRFFPDSVQQGLALAKFFYFFFFAAFGSLFPLLAVYFKQLGMDAAHCGFLIGVRPIIEYLATPFWNQMADKLQKGKLMLLVAVASWILFTLPIGYIHPTVVSCKYYNGSQFLVQLPKNTDASRSKRSIEDTALTPDTVDELPRALPLLQLPNQEERHVRVKRDAYDHRWAPGYVVGTSPQDIRFTSNYNEKQHKQWVTPAFSNEVFEKERVHTVFFFILLLVIIGEFFSSPAIALADSAVITLLGEEHQDKYGSQRMFGSIGWGLAMFIMGMVLDHSRFPDSKCDANDSQRNYHVCFMVFAFLMFCALLVATQIPFRYSVVATNNVPMNNLHQPNGGVQQAKRPADQKDTLKGMAEKTKVFAQQLRSMPEFNAVFKAMANLRLLTFMIVAWVMGVGMGLIFTFLFWHLQDFGGGPTLFGIASVINHLSEMVAYFYTFKFITNFGHIKVLAAGLLCNCLRFLYISFFTWPWAVLPFEFVQGITHAAVWAACCSFIAHNTDAELRPSAQGVLQGIHHGFGKFCGAVFGGMLIKEHGTVIVFRAYGGVCAVFLVLFVLVNFYSRNEGGMNANLPDDIDPKSMTGEGGHLAPHGVPSAPMPRALSSTKLDDQEAQQQQQHQQGPNLAVPGAAANNPFLADVAADQQYNYSATGSRVQQQDDQYYGRGYSHAQSGYSSSGLGLQ